MGNPIVNNSNLKGFLSNLSLEDIEKIKSDVELTDKDIQIVYVVDTYDIVNFTLPFTDRNYLENLKNPDVFYKAISYEKVFGSQSRCKLGLFDEYKVELLSIKNNLQNKLKDFPNFKRKFLQILIDRKEEFEYDDDEKAIHLIKQHFDLFLFTLIFIEHGENIYDRFFNFLSERIDIFEFKSGDHNLDYIVNKTLEETKPGLLSVELFDKFVSEATPHLLSLDTDLDRYIYLENSFRDIAVVDRIVNLNFLLEEKAAGKVVFYYLSSAPFKSAQIFNILLNKGLPSSGNETNRYFNAHRNIYQVFLHDFLQENFKGEDRLAHNFLDALLAIKQDKQQYKDIQVTEQMIAGSPNVISTTSFEIVKKLEILLVDSKNDLETSFFYSVYSDYQKKLDKGLAEMKKLANYEKLPSLITNMGTYLNQEHLFNNEVHSTITNLEKVRQTFLLETKMRYLRGEKLEGTYIPFGGDVVKSSYHHLPYLLFYNDREERLSQLLFRLFNFITENPTEHEKISTKFNENLEEVIELLQALDRSMFKNLIKEVLTLSFINIITPAPKSFKRTNYYNILLKEDEIVSTLKTQRLLAENAMIRPSIKETSGSIKLISQKRYAPLIKEIDYMLVWLYRRGKKFQESIEICESYTNKDVDFRFMHGRGLSYCAQAYDIYFFNVTKKTEISIEDTKKTVIKLLNYSISDLNNALKFYNEELDTTDNKDLHMLLNKTIIAIINSLIDSRLRILELSGNLDKGIITSCRKDLVQLKSIYNRFLSEKSANYRNHPPMNHTEAELEYYEAMVHLINKDYGRALGKIIEATKRIDTFEKVSYFPNEFKSIKDRIYQARILIYQNLNTLGFNS